MIFGENAVHELQQIAPVAWFRCYSSEENMGAGEKLVEETASSLVVSFVCTKSSGIATAFEKGQLEVLWVGARERFLAPWIFGLSGHDEALCQLASRTGTKFWALTEYGRGMGHIHSYTKGLGAMIPTGWTLEGEPGGVFRSIQRAPRTESDWCRAFAEHCGIADEGSVRLWWFYSRKDDEKKHDFRVLAKAMRSDAPAHASVVSKVVPVGADGNIITDANEKTSGEKLAEQLFQASSDPNFKPDLNVACAEVAAGCASQLSQFIWGILYDPAYTSGREHRAADRQPVDIIITPNIFTQWRQSSGSACVVAEVAQLDLVRGGRREEKAVPSGRRLFICSTKMPRAEMRTFMEQCEERVYTTGDQSLAEAIFMGKLPCIRPDAKVQQWKLAMFMRLTGKLDVVPDLGAQLRQLVESQAAREEARQKSQLRSQEFERHVAAQLGGGPATWSPSQQVLAKAGMMG